jgi:hypothetical protein
MASSHYTLPNVTITPQESIILYIPHTTFREKELRGAVAFLLSSIREGDFSNRETMEVSMAAFTLSIPDLAPMFASMKSFRVTSKTVTFSDFEHYVMRDREGEDGFGSLPRLGEPVPDAMAVDSIAGVYAGMSSLLMAIGKQGGSGPEAAAVNARPAALISRFGLKDDQQALLPGRSAGPTAGGLDRIYTAYSTYTEPRAVIVRYFLAISAQQGHLPLHLEIMMTNFRLIRGAGMTHVGAIIKFMNMHPWAVRIPELRPYFEQFAREYELFTQIPEDIRNYHRLLVPQSDFMFLTSEYRPLIAVAGAFIEEVEQTFAGYVYGKGDYSVLIHKVQAYQPGTSAYVGVGTLASKLGIQDMTLPKQAEIAGTQASQMS